MMSEQERRFEVFSVGHMRAKYYTDGEKPPKIRLDPRNVPVALQPLIPLAEKWGISDDILRGDHLASASLEEVAELRKTVAAHEDELDLWLAGPEAKQPPFSSEYLAFTNMRMAADGC
jgi:hypothetical protein